ncbi:MAG: indolepyruvate ferredoxin oxidoreductase subunit alpha [Planctomycetia bacterium]|nr:indolepyruvate ferredoxin oxidoreductase subunit alpha [Planctomycetia bacterium]
MKHLLSGNEAFARGIYEAGVTFAVGYPGTPSTEILENCVKFYGETVRCEWAPNEKVALEAAAGAAMAGARAVVTMKHVGLNVAADPLMSLAYTGTQGALIIIVADDPGMHSSQNEQDSRHYARFAKIPVLEPADSQEARDFILKAAEISEKYRTPVLVRTTTRVSHSRSLLELHEPVALDREIGFQKDPSKTALIPFWAKKLRVVVEERLKKMTKDNSDPNGWGVNVEELRSDELGIVTEGIAYQYVREVFPNASVLKLGCPFPFPEALVRNFSYKVRKVLVVEEVEDFTEQHLRAAGIACEGKSVVPNIGELSCDVLRESKSKLEAPEEPRGVNAWCKAEMKTPLPNRPPTLCAGCPHRGVFYALNKMDVNVTGDIGCYSLGVSPPLSSLDTIICMGAGFSMAHGMAQSGQSRKTVGILGDSTFFHSGITGLLNIAWNKVNTTVIVLDNRTTAMTGHQENPGSGKNLMGEETIAADITEIGRACGMKNIAVFNPLDHAETVATLKRAVESDEPWLLVSKSPCVLILKERMGAVRKIDPEKCKTCKQCLKLGCPAIEYSGDVPPTINSIVCNGCSLCNQICKFGAISE